MRKKKERTVERPFRDYVEKKGDICLKVGSSGRKGYPDRLVLMQGGGFFYLELKRLGENPTKLQYHIHYKLREAGFVVHWADSKEKAILYYKEEKLIQGDY